MAASIKAHPVSAAEDIGTAASVIAQRVSVAKRSEAATITVSAVLSVRMRASVERGSRLSTTASYNKRLVPTHTGEAPLLAAQARRWA